MSTKPTIRIDCFPTAHSMIRAAPMAHELISTFESELADVTLSSAPDEGTFSIWLDSQALWSRHKNDRFPVIDEIKRLIRDLVAPERDLDTRV